MSDSQQDQTCRMLSGIIAHLLHSVASLLSAPVCIVLVRHLEILQKSLFFKFDLIFE